MALTTAAAAAPPGSASAAQALFENGRAAMQQGRLEKACALLAESYRLEPALGTLLNLAVCHEQRGQTATAYLRYTEALSQASREKDSERRALVQSRIDELAPKLSRVVFSSVPANYPPGFWIILDGVRLGPVVLNVAMPADPGKHLVRYGAPGFHSSELRFTVPSGPAQVPVLLGELVREVEHERALSRASAAQIWCAASAASAGAGLTALAFGIYASVRAAQLWSDRNDECSSSRCSAKAVVLGDNAREQARVATVGTVLGVAFSAVGAYGLLSSCSAQTSQRTSSRTQASPASSSREIGVATPEFLLDWGNHKKSVALEWRF